MSRLGGDQLSYLLVRNAAAYYDAGGTADLVAFFQNAARPHRELPFASMNVTEAADFAGALVATTESTAASLLRLPGPRAKFFYAWDLGWLRSALPYRTGRALYANPAMPVIARSETHRRAVEDCWGVTAHAVVEDFDVTELVRVTS